MNTIEQYKKFVLNTYSKDELIFVKGKGSILESLDGRKFIDLFPGWGVSILGHSHPSISKVLCEQSKRLIHLPNNFYHPLQSQLAQVLLECSFKKGKVFFCNSGTEAVEAALKLARARSDKRKVIISMKNSFHGRTMGSLSLTAQQKYQKFFKPLLPKIRYAKFGDFESLKSKVDSSVGAVILEPIQGEGGVNVASREYFFKIRKLCENKDIILIFDEVQTGMGRTGKWFCYQHFGVEPDILCVAKGLGAGFPIGAIIVKDKFKDVLKPGMHASTFGGSPLACRVALEVIKVIRQERLLENVRKKSAYIFRRLFKLRKEYNVIREIRGLGFMIGVEVREKADVLKRVAQDKGLLINRTQDKVIRIMPALNISLKVLKKALDILEDCFKEVYG